MATRQPSPGAQRIISKIVVNLLDGQEVPISRAMADASFADTGEALGMVRPDGSLEFDEAAVGRPLERAAEPGRLSDQEVADFRRAIQAVTFTTLSKRVEGPDVVIEDGADRFVDAGLREAYWTVHGQRIAYNASPEHGSRLLDVQDESDHPVAREAALALANHYAKANHDLPDNAVRSLLKTPRDRVFEEVVDATLAGHLRDRFEPARDDLAELRSGMARDLRNGFRELSEADGPAEVSGRVAQLYERVDASARTVKETMTAMGAQQGLRSSAAAAQDRASAPSRDRRHGLGMG